MLEIIKYINCSIILVAHSGKDENRGIKGASDFGQDADTVFQVSTNRDRFSIVTMEKQKEAEEWSGPRAFQLVDSADSMVPVMASTNDAGADEHTIQAEGIGAIVGKVLLATASTFTTTTLAAEVVRALHPDLSDQSGEEWVTLQRKTGQKLRNLSKNDGLLGKYIVKRGIGTEPHIWQHPEYRDN